MPEVSAVKDRLTARRRELLRRLDANQSEERTEVRESLDDHAQLWEVSEVRDALDDDLAVELKRIDEALARLDAGEYGTCVSCGGSISQARLESLPYATHCIRCVEKPMSG